MKETSLDARGYLYGLAVALVWGAQPVVATFGYRAGLNAFDLTLLRFTASGLLMLPILIIFRALTSHPGQERLINTSATLIMLRYKP